MGGAANIEYRSTSDHLESVNGVDDLKPWATTMSEVQSELGEAEIGDHWTAEHRLNSQLPTSSKSDTEEVKLTFIYELLQSVGICSRSADGQDSPNLETRRPAD